MIALPTLHLGRGAQAGPLTVFPIWTDAPVVTHRPYTTTLRGNGAVTELPDHPQVDTLVVTQPGPKPLLMLEGALISGGWQHRVLTRDILVAADQPMMLDVRCVEAGRWHSETTQCTERRAAPLAVRGALRGIRPDQSLARENDHIPRSADQGDVWNRVSAYEHRFGAGATSSLIDVQRRHEQTVDRIVRKVRPLFGQRGVLVGVAGHPVLIEVFDHPRTLVELLATIVASVALDAIGLPAAPTSNTRARQFVQHLQRAHLVATIREAGVHQPHRRRQPPAHPVAQHRAQHRARSRPQRPTRTGARQLKRWLLGLPSVRSQKPASLSITHHPHRLLRGMLAPLFAAGLPEGSIEDRERPDLRPSARQRCPRQREANLVSNASVPSQARRVL